MKTLERIIEQKTGFIKEEGGLPGCGLTPPSKEELFVRSREIVLPRSPAHCQIRLTGEDEPAAAARRTTVSGHIWIRAAVVTYKPLVINLESSAPPCFVIEIQHVHSK